MRRSALIIRLSASYWAPGPYLR